MIIMSFAPKPSSAETAPKWAVFLLMASLGLSALSTDYQEQLDLDVRLTSQPPQIP